LSESINDDDKEGLQCNSGRAWLDDGSLCQRPQKLRNVH